MSKKFVWLINHIRRYSILHIVLVNPEIPQNTGNIARTCALTQSVLHLVRPLGFSIEDRYLKRAGLDYWDKVEVKVWESFEEVVDNYRNSNIYLATTKAQTSYEEVDYQLDDMVVFGCETRGLPQEILKRYPRQQIRIPMLDIGRSLNLSNSVAIIVYEVLRQHKFPNLK
jgi:tRNA (cytidine/uridine-2'-O-)-methyltransferase